MKQRVFDYSFLAIGLLVQLITFWIANRYLTTTNHQTWLSLLSGCLGICSVCLASQGNILTYAFGFAQVGTYMILVIANRLLGQVALNVFYLITMIYGVYVWRQRLHENSRTVTPRRLSLRMIILIGVAMLLFSALAGWGLSTWIGNAQPYLDAFTSIPALVVQVLTILAFREQWFIWLAVDILNVILWLRVGDYCMAAQYIFWCANCIYGLNRWKSIASEA